jgi:hypothetical protein
VRKRIRVVIDWALPRLTSPGPFELMAKDLRAVFGNGSSNPLSTWLMANALQQTGFYKVGAHPYAYFINTDGLEKMLKLLADFDASKNTSNATGGNNHKI